MMKNELNGIILNGKIYEATEDNAHSCMKCDLIDEFGQCSHSDFCFEQGRNNIFRLSQSLTDKINRPAMNEELKQKIHRAYLSQEVNWIEERDDRRRDEYLHGMRLLESIFGRDFFADLDRDLTK